MKNEPIDPMTQEKDEKSLLALMYEVQEKMEPLIDDGKEDEDYKAFERLVSRLENYILNKNQSLL